MNISFTNLKSTPPAFCARAKKPQKTNLEQPAADVVEISSKTPAELPRKLELTEIEKQFDEVLREMRTMNSNLASQKQNLHDFYSACDKAAYKDLLKESYKLASKLTGIAKRAGMDSSEMEAKVDIKRAYNRFAPKAWRAQTKEELRQLQIDINSRTLYIQAQELLNQLIEQCLRKL